MTIVSSLQRLTLQDVAATKSDALAVDDKKVATNHSASHSAGIWFVPLVVECLSGWSYEAVESTKVIGYHQAQRWDCLNWKPFLTPSSN